jgi:alpha,alpha-trehalase
MDASINISPAAIQAVIFDMDGVVTQTATVHAAAWKRLFDDYLERRARREGRAFRPFDADEDYRLHVDGKPRHDGVRDFLASRGIALPWGRPQDPSDAETVCGLGNRKNRYFVQEVEQQGVQAFPSTIVLVRALRRAGVRTAVISASRNATRILEAAGARQLFEAQVDGGVAEQMGLAGKPDPAVFLEAARRLRVEPDHAAVVEDALAGVEAGRRGSFALVIGIDRSGRHPSAMRAHGADVVVSDLAEVAVASPC